ncbi:ATP-binding protein [Nonomuraea sp. NPDC002799]
MKAASAEPRVIGSIHLAGIRESVSQARSEVRRWLGEDHPSVDDAVLAASELVTNALRHSDARPYDLIGLTVTATEGMVYVEVRDPGSTFSAPHIRQEPEAADGRGLLIVSEISQDWGIREHGCGLGRTVWCVFRSDLSAPEPVSGSAGGRGSG